MIKTALYRITSSLIVTCLLLLGGCQQTIEDSEPSSETQTSLALTEQLVEASCGQCQFGMDGSGCDLAIRVDGKHYPVEGTGIDDHGDAHGDDGLCNCIRKATVSGEVVEGRFIATKFELQAKVEEPAD